jgi:Undecaprenyl-phosphate glucose phosphotransferase
MEKLREDDLLVAEPVAAPAVDDTATVLPFDVTRRRSGVVQTSTGRLIIACADAAVIVLMSLVSGFGYHAIFKGEQGDPLLFLATGLLASLLFVVATRTIEANQLLRRPDGTEAVRDLTLAWVATIMCVTFFAFALKAGADLSRGTLLTFLILGWFGIFAARTTVPRLITRYYRPQRLVARDVIVIGAADDPALDTVLGELGSAGYAAPRVIRFNAHCAPQEWRRELAASMTRVKSLARRAANGEICIVGGGIDDRRLRDIAVGLQVVPRAVRIIPTPAVEQLLHNPVRNIGALNAVELQKAPLNNVQRAVKRAIDLAAASVALLALAPFLAFVALAIKLGTRGPVFFKQTRLGYRSEPFAIYKFRTMTVAENGADVKQAQANDRRVTPLGRWLRKTSIDELPQLLNVIWGQMSLVGPRPHAVAHDEHYKQLIDNYEIRQHVKPGITGWAQVNGLRGETSSPDLMRRRVEADIWYAKNASILLDIRILLLTVVEVLRQRNAY